MPQRLKNIYHLLVAFFSVIFFRYPARKLIMIGVTGTDGKTTISHLIYEILKKAGKKVSLISSVGAKIGGKDYNLPFHVTTPSSWQLQKFLRLAVDKKEEYMVLEVTSHALDQNRVFGCNFFIGVITNITFEHLDYHKTYKNYLATKAKLFKGIKWAVLNKDDASYENLKSQILNSGGGKIISYGIHQGEVNIDNFPFQTSLPGEYNKLNCLAAITVAKILGIPEEIIKQAIVDFKGVIGRFEFIETGKGFKVLIDFAHTPNGLEKFLSTVKPQVKGRLIHVFGAAGLRDHLKRPKMGKIAAKYDDIIILTEEDYRTENVNQIIEEIEGGIISLKKKINLYKIPDRQEAINKAIKLAKRNDWVVLTGKGHEKSLCRGKIEYPWSEHQAVLKALQA